MEAFVEQWRDTGGSELANTQSFINGLCSLIGVEPPHGSRTDDAHNDYVFERRVFQDNGDGTKSFGRIDAYKRGAFILEAKQGSEADRAAAERGEDDLDFFGQTASARLKRGTARRGTPGWAKAMVQAKGQAERYAKALPVDHGWPPFLLVADIGYCIEVYADFSGTGKAYAQFPDRSRYRIMLEDLRDAEVRERLAAIWTDPAGLDPSAKAARVTREIADLLATVSRRLEARGHSAEAVSGFLMRILFTMFAEDTGVLLPQDSFKGLLRGQLDHPEHLHHQLSALWKAMDRGEFAPALGIPVKRFNGYLFKDTQALPLEAEELKVLIEASLKDWTEVEPAIFGTLLERALNPKERAKLGAHYTPRAYVERLVGPTIMEPLRADWAGVRVEAAELIDQGKADAARKAIEAFHTKLAQTRVLDPACGTGNFLYVAMARMKELEGEVLDLLLDLGDDQYLAELTGHTITPENFLGIEINPRAAAIAQLVLWIGYLQWHFRVNGRDRAPPEPILRDVRTIENRDALIDYDERVLERDEHGEPVSRWDGETMKTHPVTGKAVPDEAARAEVHRYANPRPAKWPKADFIIGNPPFVGNKRMRERLGGGYLDALGKVYREVPKSVDLVMYWWARASALSRLRKVRRFGYITTNSITQPFNARLIKAELERPEPTTIVFAIADHPWRDVETDAAVRVAMTVGERGQALGRVFEVSSSDKPGGETFVGRYGKIGPELSLMNANSETVRLLSNAKLSFQGMTLVGEGFRLTPEQRQSMIESDLVSAELIHPYIIGRDLVQRRVPRFVIDAFGLTESELSSRYPVVYEWLYLYVRPERMQNNREAYRAKWWVYAEPRSDLRSAKKHLGRYLATCRTSKHRIFSFEDVSVVPDAKVIFIGLEDALYLGILSSRIHTVWAIATGAHLEDRPNYNHSDCFGKFPFPGKMSPTLQGSLRDAAERLDALRKDVLSKHEDVSLTKLYNLIELIRVAEGKGLAISDADRLLAIRSCASLIRQHHDAIDEAVADAYGWGDEHRAGTLDDETILTRLVALNKERAAEEARGLIRYLRPEFQDPGYRAPVAEQLDLGETEAAPVSNVVPWPATLTDQVGAVQSILAAAPRPLAAQDIARSFKGKRASTVKPVLDALAGLGMARRLNDGRYAA